MTGAVTVVINADDFGLSPEVNAGILVGYRMGLLRSCSLMVAERAVDEAVEIARQHPGLAVGLHVALTDATPCLRPATIPDLVGPDGRFHPVERVLRRRLWRSPAARRQMRAEIDAQLAAFARTGLICDHVDGHRNVELDPFVAQALFTAARRYGVTAVRVPAAPDWALPTGTGALGCLIRQARVWALHRFARRTGLACYDYSVDLKDVDDLRIFPSRFDADALVEVYVHPAARMVADRTWWNPDLQRLLDEQPKVVGSLGALQAAAGGHGVL